VTVSISADALAAIGSDGIRVADLSPTLRYELGKSTLGFGSIVRTEQGAMPASFVVPLNGKSAFVANEPRGGTHAYGEDLLLAFTIDARLCMDGYNSRANRLRVRRIVPPPAT